MARPDISIIIPLFNAEDNISSLIDSIKDQTFVDWELILVNDGSSDNTLEICERYAHKDERISIICQSNQGPSAARNAGMKVAVGEWITFIDSDDSILENYFSSMMEIVKSHPDVDMVFAGYELREQKTKSIYSYDTAIYSGYQSVRDALIHKNILHRCSPWGKLFRRGIVTEHKLEFDVNLWHSEDRIFFYEYIIHVNSIATTSSVGYIYNSTSATSLKHKRLEIEKIYYRQSRLQNEARRVLDYFEIEGKDCFIFAKNLFNVFASGIQGIYDNYGYSRITIQTQNKFFERYFDAKLYADVKESEDWKNLMNENRMLKMAVSKEFKNINKHLCIIRLKTALYHLTSKLVNTRF